MHICAAHLTDRGSINLSIVRSISAVAVLASLWLAVNPAPITVLLLGLFALAYINYLVGGRDILYPAFTFTSVWAMVAVVYYLYPAEIDPLGGKTVLIFLGGGASFSLGSLIGNRRSFPKRPMDGEEPKTEVPGNSSLRIVLLSYTILVVFFYLLDVRKIGEGSISLSPMFLIELRMKILASYVEGVNPYSSRFVTSGFVVVPLVFWIFIMEEKRKWAVGLCAACVGLYSIFSTGRTQLMMVLCGWLFLSMLRRKDRTFRRTKWPLGFAASGIIVLLAVNSLLTKAETQGPDALNAATSLTLLYVAGPLAGFNHAVYHPEDFNGQPSVIFADVLAPLSRLGVVRYELPEGVDRTVFAPFPINVYTCYKPYYEELGAIGCFAAFVLLGGIQGHLFGLAVRGSRVAALVGAFLTYPLMFSTFDDHYHSLTGTLIVIVFSLAYCHLPKRMKFRI